MTGDPDLARLANEMDQVSGSDLQTQVKGLLSESGSKISSTSDS